MGQAEKAADHATWLNDADLKWSVSMEIRWIEGSMLCGGRDFALHAGFALEIHLSLFHFSVSTANTLHQKLTYPKLGKEQ